MFFMRTLNYQGHSWVARSVLVRTTVGFLDTQGVAVLFLADMGKIFFCG